MPNVPLDGYPYVPDRSGNGMGVVDIPAKVLPVSKGGTGLDHYEIGDLLVADTTISLTRLDAEPVGKVLISKGEDVMPEWNGIPINGYSGMLPPANGGTGTNVLFTQGSIVFAGPGGVYTQDNTNFKFDDTLNALCVGGTVNAPGDKIRAGGPISGNTITNNFSAGGSIQPDVTVRATGFASSINTAATPFTIDSIRQFSAELPVGTPGAGSTINNQYGFFVESTLIGAINNYGFYGNIPAGTNRWNFYAAGTAKNHFQGPTTVGNNPALPMEVATKAYVDAATGVGGAVTEAPSDGNQYSRKNASWVKTDTEFVKKVGDAITGNLSIAGALSVGGSAVVTGTISAAAFYADANYWMAMQAPNPVLAVDVNDYLVFDRASNVYQFRVAGVTQFSVNPGSCQVGSAGSGVMYIGDGNSYVHADATASTWLWEPGSYFQYNKTTDSLSGIINSAIKFTMSDTTFTINSHLTVVNDVASTAGVIRTATPGAGNIRLEPGSGANAGILGIYRADNTRMGYIGFNASPSGSINYSNDLGGGHVFGGGYVGVNSNNLIDSLCVQGYSDGQGIMIQFPFAPTGTNGGQLSFNNWAGDSVLHGMGAIKTYCTFGTPGNYSSNMDFYISRAGAYQLGMRLDSNSDLTVMGSVRSGGLIYPGNDATFYFSFNAGAPMLHFDSNNYMYFSRAVKSYNFIVNGTNPLIIKQQAVGINIEPVVAFHVNSQGPMIRWQCWAAGGNDFYQTWYNGDTRISYEGFVGTVAKQWVLENAGQFYWSTNGRNMVFNEVGHLNLGDSVSDFGAILNVSSNTNHIAWFNTYTNPPIPVVTQRADPGKVCLFLYNGATAGWIDIITTTTVGYQSTSDARLKTNIVPAAPAGSIIDAINIVEHDWIKGGHTAYGVIAQDLHPVFPDAVSVGNDELTLPRAAVEAKPEVKNKEGVITQHAEEGHPAYAGGDLAKPWGVDYSKMVPLLIKEIQELRARVAVLEAV